MFAITDARPANVSELLPNRKLATLSRAVPGPRGLPGRPAQLPAAPVDLLPEPDNAVVEQDVLADRSNKSRALNKLLAHVPLAINHQHHAIPVTRNRLSL